MKIIFIFFFIFVFSKEVYISNQGIDNNECGMKELPCQSIEYSMNKGDILILLKGEHILKKTLSIRKKIEIKSESKNPLDTIITCFTRDYIGFIILSDFIFKDLTIQKCKGGMRIEETNTKLYNIHFIDHQTRFGGALNILNSFVEIELCLFKLNKAIENTNGVGGAIYIDNSDVNITRSEFRNNFALEKAGAVSIREANTQILDSLFIENSVPKGSIYHSGALNLDAVTKVFIRNTSFIKNKGQNFGALSGTGVITLSKCLFKENISYKQDNCVVDLDYAKVYDTIIENNQGCGISTTQCEVYNSRIISNKGIGFIDSETKRSKSIIQNTLIAKNLGTGLFIFNSRIELSHLILDQNQGKNGGGIYLSNLLDSSFIRDSIIQNNLATLGGGLYLNSNIRLFNNKFINNKAINGSGIYLLNHFNILSNENHFINNNATRGGGLFLFNSNIDLSKSLISNNYALNGGGIYCHNSTILGNPNLNQNREDNYHCIQCINCLSKK